MSDTEYLNWTIPAERYNDLTASDIANFKANLKKSFEYYITEGADAAGFYMTPDGDNQNVPHTVEELSTMLDADLRYEQARRWVTENFENKEWTGDEIRDALGTESIGAQGSVASKLAGGILHRKAHSGG